MDETKEHLKQLINFFTGSFLSSPACLDQDSDNGEAEDGTLAIKTLPTISATKAIVRQDINLIIKTLELCKKNITHFSTSERQYLMPLMTLCGHVLLMETQLIPRALLATVSDLLIYVLQYLLNELSLYSDDESNFSEFNPVFLRKLSEISNFSIDCEEYYRFILKYRITKFLSFMLIDDEKSSKESFFSESELVTLCQMLSVKPMPDSLRCHSNTAVDSASTTSSTSAEIQKTPSLSVSSSVSSALALKRIHLSAQASSERNSKEEFFDQLLTPFIVSSSNIPSSSIQAGVNIQPAMSMSAVPSSRHQSSSLSTLVMDPEISKTSATMNPNKSQSAQIRTYLINHNQMYFQYVGGANILLNLINSFTLLRPYILHLLAIEEGAVLRFTKLESAKIDLICDRIESDIDLVASIFELNRLLEPLSCDRISKMVVTVQACLYACLTLISHANCDNNNSSAESSSKQPTSQDNEISKIEKTVFEIMQKSLRLYTSLFDIFRQSNRVAGQICQNAHMFTAWLMFSGLHMILHSNKSTSNTSKKQGYSFLCIPLAKHAIKLMSYLLDDLHLEFGDQNVILDDQDEASSESMPELNFFKKFSFNSGTTSTVGPKSANRSSPPSQQQTGSPSSQLSPSASQTNLTLGSNHSNNTSSNSSASTGNNIRATFKYNKFGHYSAWQRIDMIFSSNLNVIHLLFGYLSAGYRRAGLLRHSSLTQMSAEEQPYIISENEFSSLAGKFMEQLGSDSSKETDESFKLSLLFDAVNEQFIEEKLKKTEAANDKSAELRSIYENDIDSHYELVIAILDHLNYYYICSKIDALQDFFKQMLTDAQLIVLAHIIQDIDFELENIQMLSPLSSKTFYNFSSSLTSLMHNLIAMQTLSEDQQNSLLAYLRFKPSTESESSWPLYHGARSLAILAQIILLRQQKEKEDIKLDLNSITIQIWRGFINQLKQASLKFKGELSLFNDECPAYYEDLNVEHAQLMLFLFHNLKLLQRKHVFYLVGLALHEISLELCSTTKRSVSAAQILFIGRLLHFFEYMCKNLYDTPAYLFEQINHNLLNLIVPRDYNDSSADDSKNTDNLRKAELDKCFASNKYPESFRNILFIADKKLELNYYNYMMSQKDFSLPASSTMGGTASLGFMDFVLHPRFYHLMDINYLFTKNSLSRNFVPKLDGMACNFMLAGFSSLTYEQFYNSLLNLFGFLGYQYDVDVRNQSQTEPGSSSGLIAGLDGKRLPQFGPFGLCSLDFTFQTMWRLINQLPPTLQSLNDVVNMVQKFKEGEDNYEIGNLSIQSLSGIDAARIVNMCIWVPRFENSRPAYIWVRELLAKVTNSTVNNPNSTAADGSLDSPLTIPKTTVSNVEEAIAELLLKFNSLEFNYNLLKYISWSFFRYNSSCTGANSAFLFNLTNQSSSVEQQLNMKSVQFPKFFTLFSIDLYIERIAYLFANEYQSNKVTVTANGRKREKVSFKSEATLSTGNNGSSNKNKQETIENYLDLLIGLFDKLYNDINTTLIYDGPLSSSKLNNLTSQQQSAIDLKYLYYRSLVNICSTDSFDSSLSDISSNIVDFLPQNILYKIDQWNRIYANVESSATDTELQQQMMNGIPFEMPIVEMATSSATILNISGNSSASSSTLTKLIYNPDSSSSSNCSNLNYFSSILNEKYSIIDFPNVSSIETGFGNITWIKLKQFWVRLFKFVEFVYSKKATYFQYDPFLIRLLSMQLNLVSSSLTHNISEASNSPSYKILDKAYDLKADGTDVYCSALYPQFIRNAFFILTVFKNPSFNCLHSDDVSKFLKIHQDCSSEFFQFFAKILKKSSGKWAFEEFLCETAPTTPTTAPELTDIGQSAGTALATSNSPNQSSFSFLDLIEIASHPLTSSCYAINLLQLLKTLLSQAEKNSDDISIIRICSALSASLADHQDRVTLLSKWFHLILFHQKNEDKPSVSSTESSVPTEQSIVSSTFNTNQSISSMAYIEESASNEIYLLYKFVCYVVKDTSRFDEVVLASMAEALLPNAQKLLSETLLESRNFLAFSGLFTSLVFLMSASGNSDEFIQSFGQSCGHLKLIQEVVNWLSLCKDYLSKKEVIRKIEKSVSQGRHRFILESSYQMLSYLSDIFNALEYKFVYLKSRKPAESLIEDNKNDKSNKESSKAFTHHSATQIFIDDDFDEADLNPYESSAISGTGASVSHQDDDEFEDEDEEDDLCNKLCTFTVTQKEFINQHWYHCHTCKMLDGVGSCTICAKVCHRGHDVTYSKLGSFFCDCGAGEDGSCRALVKRQPTAKSNASKSSKRLSKSKASSLPDKKKLLRISKYWFNSLNIHDFNPSKLADNYKFSRNKFTYSVITENYERFGLKFENMENFINQLIIYISPISDTILSLVEYFVPTLEDFLLQHSELGYITSIRKEFARLHSGSAQSNCDDSSSSTSIPLSLEKCEQMLIPVKSWQASLFDNVQISNEQTTAVRHLTLITGAIVRRVSMLVLGGISTPKSSQHNSVHPSLLLVVHEKNRIAVVQLNHLLTQVYSNSRRKLNVQRLATITFPFTIMTMSHNPLNEELIAICGLKECHVLSLARNGAVTGHYSLSMTFDTNNHIIKAFWLPDSQTELAIVTLDFIKIYDLSRDERDIPVYNFVIPSRKIRDMTFFSTEENLLNSTKRFILIFSSRGQIYAQELNADSMCSPPDSPFYVTSIINVTYPESWSPSSQQTVVGFSIYYSHLLQFLFVSYLNGNSFCAPFNLNNIYRQQITNVTSLDSFSSSGSNTSSQSDSVSSQANGQDLSQSANSTPVTTNIQPLFQWTEVFDHPGLVFALTMNTNCPVGFMVKSNTIIVQELRPKKKVIDFSVVSNLSVSISENLSSTNNKITTLIGLCDDGSLRFYRASSELTNFWLKPNYISLEDSSSTCGNLQRKQKSTICQKSVTTASTEATPSSSIQPRFPVDFFEQCTLMNDIEFGGSDVLEVYNTQQIKSRLNSANMYIACTKPNGFSITVTQTANFNEVMSGVRINLGVCDPVRAPTAIEVFGRSKTVAINRHRWFDIPFTRTEIRQIAESKTFSIRFAPSSDINNVTIVDSIRVYGRPRDSMGLDAEDEAAASVNTSSAVVTSQSENSNTATQSAMDDYPSVRPTATTSTAAALICSKSPDNKLRLLLYAPTITDDELLSTMSNHQGIFVLNRLLANCLDVLEGSFSFFKSLSELSSSSSLANSNFSKNNLVLIAAHDFVQSPEYQQKCDTALSISSKLLTISLSDCLDRSVCMLMAKLLPTRISYDEHRDEVIFENAIESLKYLAYDDVIVFNYNLSLFREMVAERPRNFVRFIAKYFVESNDITASTMHFNSYLGELFWRLYQQRPANDLLAPVTKASLFTNLEQIVDALVFIFHASMFAALTTLSDSTTNLLQSSENQQTMIRKSSQLILQFLCSSDPQISYSTKKALSRIFTVVNPNGLVRHNSDKQQQSKTASSKSPSSKADGSSHRERRQSGTSGVIKAIPSTSAEPASNSNPVLRRQGALRHRSRSSGSQPSTSNGQSSNAEANVNDLLALNSSSGSRSTNEIERVTHSLLGSDFEAYRNLILNAPNLGEDFDEEAYFNDFIAVNVDGQGNDEIDDDDDDFDDDELDMNIPISSRNNQVSAPPPLYPIMDGSPFAANNAEQLHHNQDNILEEADEEANEDIEYDYEEADDDDDDDDEDDDDEEDEEDDYEAMEEDEDAMMELAIALSLQDQQSSADAQSSTPSRAQPQSRSHGGPSFQVLNQYLRNLNESLQSIDDNAAQIRAGRPSSAHQSVGRQSSASSQARLSQPERHPPPRPSTPQHQEQQPDYLMLHSESDEDDEALFAEIGEEMKLTEAPSESIDVDAEEEDEDELNSIDTSHSSLNVSLHPNLKTRSISKSNETITKSSRHSHGHHHHSDNPNEKSSTAICKSTCPKHKKRLRKMITSKLCVTMLKQMASSIDTIVKLDGVQAIPFLQVVTMLADYKYCEVDQKEFGTYLTQIVVNLLNQLFVAEKSVQLLDTAESTSAQSSVGHNKRKSTLYKERIERKPLNEVLLLIMRLFSVFLSRLKHFPSSSIQLLMKEVLKDLATFCQTQPQQPLSSTTLVGTSSSSTAIVPTVSFGPSKAVTFDEQSIKGSNTAPGKDRINQNTYSLLLTAGQLVNSNSRLLNYCFSLLQQLLRNHWRPLDVHELDSDNKNKAVIQGETIVYHSKKPIKIRPHMNFIPSDLKPFFMIVSQVPTASSASSTGQTVPTTQAEQAVPNDSGITISSNTSPTAPLSSDTCTTLNAVIFSNNVFDRYAELLTEMSLRLPYQLKKLTNSLQQQQQQQPLQSQSDEKRSQPTIEFDSSWIEILCEYMMLPSVTPYIRKQVRKLLAYLCGSKERYRQVRDYYAIKTHLRAVRRIIVWHFFDSNSTSLFKLKDLNLTEDDLDDEEQLDELIELIIGSKFLPTDDKTSMMSSDQHRLLNLPYSQLISLVDYLKACLEIANSRILNWQRLCRRELRILPFLFRISLLFGEGISSIILQLLSLALFTQNQLPSSTGNTSDGTNKNLPSDANTLSNFILTETKLQSDLNSASSSSVSPGDQHLSILCRYVFAALDRPLLSHFIRYFLLESNSTQHRWAAHSLIYHFHKSLQPAQQEQLLSLFWQLWPSLACYGKRASQFVDLLGYFTLKTISSDSDKSNMKIVEIERYYAESAIGLLKYQNQVLCRHPNANIYNSLQSLLEFNGYYLETEPCLVCNNPEVNFVPVKLSSIKLDSRFTTNTQIVKLIGSHTISKIAVKISEMKKSKMVKTLTIYYNNRWVQSVVELKNKNTIWHKAKRVTLSPSQSEVKIEFALPIVACNIMIEYSNFFETPHSSTETLQCPRCSSIVPANPGVCINCGENVFQCHKCRAINYDEKDPFLCNSCGFCKYAKFDYVLTARYTATAVETIENEDDRSKAVQTINTLLDKADRLYKLILTIRPSLEQLLLSSQDFTSSLYGADNVDSSASGASTSGVSGSGAAIQSVSSSSSSSLHVNRYIQTLANRYGVDCRMHFEELSKIVQKVLYTRKELVDYDNRQNGNQQNSEDIKKLLDERRQASSAISSKFNISTSSTSLSSSCSSTLVDVSSSKSILDNKQLKQSLSQEEEIVSFKSHRCYGCCSATIEHCITLLKALAITPRYKTILSSFNLFRELIDYNLRLGSPTFRIEVRKLLCLLTRDNSEATEEFNNLLLDKIKAAFQTRFVTSFDFGSARHEMALLANLFENEDQCWEQRLRCVLKLFLMSLENKSPAVLEAITLPCLRILYGLVTKPAVQAIDTKPGTSSGKRASQSSSSQTVEQIASVQLSMSSNQSLTHIPFDSLMFNVSVDLTQWLSTENRDSFASWQQRNVRLSNSSMVDMEDSEKLALYEEQLQRKYYSRWLYYYQSGKLRNLRTECFAIRIASSTWIQEVLFNPTSKALRIACRQLLMALFERLTSKQRQLIDLFTSFLDDLCIVGGEIGLEFYDLYRSIIFVEFASASSLRAGSASNNLARNHHWRYYLTLCGLLQHLGQLISVEIDRLKQLEEATLSSNFSQGSALRQLVELLQLFMRDERIRRVHKSTMVAFVLDGYLSLRKLIVQRTKMIDESQAALLELLELLTTGTKVETINFMKICIESVKKCSLQDLRTPVFIFERLCSIIYPEEKDADEFFITLEKDPQQEDFLQGRMLGNPYSFKDPGMGPLMRDIKNKICQECELVSLLEDDSGLELLVNNKIISLDLPVKEVYKKLVCAEHQSVNSTASSSGNSGASSSSWYSGGTMNLNLASDIGLIDPITGNVFPISGGASGSGNASSNANAAGSSNANSPTMKIVYRIRGLMGDATEEFIETFSNKESVVEDDEKLFELANIMSTQSTGLQVMLERLQAITEINNRSRMLLIVLLKLFSFCVRVVNNRRALIVPELNAIGTMLGVVRLFLKTQQAELLISPSAPGEPSYFEQLLSIMETLLAEASREDVDTFDRFNQETCGSCEDIQLLLNAVSSTDSIIYNTNVSPLNCKILRIAAFLSFGHTEKMTTLISYFKSYFDFDAYDRQSLQVDNVEHRYELFCSLVSCIENNKNGARLKDLLIDQQFVFCAIEYLVRNAPTMKNFLLLNSDEWKDFTSRPALKYVLRILTGLSHGHENTQLLITRDAIPIIHGLEQILSDSHMATLAENLMDAIKENPSVEAKIQEVRLRTREEKKRIAMAVREKQLGELGMKANDKGQVMADSHLLKQMEEQLGEEKGLVCSICREGYAYQPQKVLAIYTFSKRCNVDEFEDRKPRRTVGYTTVTHFNIVHFECHLAAVRHARTRDEWQSAALHNANTRCNGLLPLWGPMVTESLFAHALSRHNSYLQDAIGQRDFVGSNSFLGTVHDLKLLLLRFASERSFSEETGGGGAQSNLYLTPYLIHVALYVINTTKIAERETNNLNVNFLNQPAERWIDNCFQVDSPYLWTTMAFLLQPRQFWNSNRLTLLQRLIFCEYVRHLPAESRNATSLSQLASADDNQVSYANIKPALMFFALIDLFYNVVFKNVETAPNVDQTEPSWWPIALSNFVRHNDQLLLEQADKMLDTFENDLLMSASFGEFCDAAELMRGTNAISDPDQFLKDSIKLPE